LPSPTSLLSALSHLSRSADLYPPLATFFMMASIAGVLSKIFTTEHTNPMDVIGPAQERAHLLCLGSMPLLTQPSFLCCSDSLNRTHSEPEVNSDLFTCVSSGLSWCSECGISSLLLLIIILIFSSPLQLLLVLILHFTSLPFFLVADFLGSSLMVYFCTCVQVCTGLSHARVLEQSTGVTS
jgi:hypothetical protein